MDIIWKGALAWLGLILLALALWRAIRRGQVPDYLPHEAPAVVAPPTTPSGRPMNYCETCVRLVAVHKGDGLPYRSHRCRIAKREVWDINVHGRDLETADRLTEPGPEKAA